MSAVISHSGCSGVEPHEPGRELTACLTEMSLPNRCGPTRYARWKPKSFTRKNNKRSSITATAKYGHNLKRCSPYRIAIAQKSGATSQPLLRVQNNAFKDLWTRYSY
jgi:hypothetical protein